jgi:hypothetical protein
MKATKLKLAALGIVAALGLFAFTMVKTGSIKGTVTPAGSATVAMAISGMDTLKTIIDAGYFNISNVKAGTYKLVIEATPPYKNLEKEGVTVSDGQQTDVGEISLQQ